MEFYDKFKDRVQDVSKERILLSATQRSSNYLEPSKLNVLGEYNVATLTIFYLKVLHEKV